MVKPAGHPIVDVFPGSRDKAVVFGERDDQRVGGTDFIEETLRQGMNAVGVLPIRGINWHLVVVDIDELHVR